MNTAAVRRTENPLGVPEGPKYRGLMNWPAYKHEKTSAIFFLNHGQRSFRALLALFAVPRSPYQAERESLVRFLTSTV